MRVAALDLGSNTSLLLIAEVEDGVIRKISHDETRVTRMGQGVHADRRLHPEALARLDRCFADYAQTIAHHNCDRVIAVATSAARDVTNSEELLALGRRHQIPIHIISGDREAHLTFRGALGDRPATRGIAVIDVGGGSTEVIREAEDIQGVSVDVGSVRLTELFIREHPVPRAQIEKLVNYTRDAFAKATLPRQGVREIVAVAGTPTTLAALDQSIPFAEQKVHGYRLTLKNIDRWRERLATMSVEAREHLPGMQAKRADVIVAGAVILSEAIRAMGKDEVIVSTRGVRYGVVLAWQDF